MKAIDTYATSCMSETDNNQRSLKVAMRGARRETSVKKKIIAIKQSLTRNSIFTALRFLPSLPPFVDDRRCRETR